MLAIYKSYGDVVSSAVQEGVRSARERGSSALSSIDEFYVADPHISKGARL